MFKLIGIIAVVALFYIIPFQFKSGKFLIEKESTSFKISGTIPDVHIDKSNDSLQITIIKKKK